MLKTLFTALLSSALACAVAPAARAQTPTMPPLVRLVVPFNAGAGTDVVARIVAPLLAARLGTQVVVDNRPGASGMIGANAVAKGPADGSMLLLMSVSLVSGAATKAHMPFDLLGSLVPAAMLGQGSMIVAVPAGSPIRTPADLIAAARAKPDELTHGTGGIGTIAHMAVELLNDSAKVQIKHIPYKGAAPAGIDLASGTLDLVVAAYSTLQPHIASGRVRPIAVTSAEPSPSFPGLPPMAQAVPGYRADIWQAVFAPAGTPAPLLQRLNHEINELMKSKEALEMLKGDGFIAVPMSTEDAARTMRDSYATWKKVATTKNIVVE